MSKKIKDEQKKFLGETLNQYDKALDEAINQLDKKNREQNHKISSLVNSFDNEYLEKDVEGNITTLENSKDGMVIINEIQGSTEVNYCKDGEKELILNGDIDTQGESFVTITESVDGGLVDVSLEGNTEINLSKTKDPVLVTREFDDINCNAGKLQYTIDDVTTINDEPGKVDIDRIVGDTMVNHAVNGSEELILNAHINESGDNSITLNGVTSDGGKVDVALEGNTLVNVSKTKDSTAITKSYTVENSGNHVALQGDVDGNCRPVITGNTLVNLHSSYVPTFDYPTDESNVYSINSSTNYISISGSNLNASSYRFVNAGKISIELFKPYTTYTIIFSKLRGVSHIQMMTGAGTEALIDNISITPGKLAYTFTFRENVTSNSQILYLRVDKELTELDIEVENPIILEGDYTDKPIPDYFEGLKSSFEDNLVTQEIVDNGEEVADNLGKYKADYVVTGKNKLLYPYFETTKTTAGITFTANNDGSITVNGTATNTANFYLRKTNEWTLPQGKYTFSINNADVRCIVGGMNADMGYNSGNGKVTFTIPKNCTNTGNLLIQVPNGATLNNVTLYLQIEEGDTATAYEPYKGYTKTLYLNSPLLEGDTIEEKEDGIYHVHRGEKVVFDGSENWENTGFGNNETLNSFYFSDTGGIPNVNTAICDKMMLKNMWDSLEEGIWIDESCVITISKSKATNIEEFKTYLSNNLITAVYQLETPTYELIEQSNLVIPSYANGHLDFNTAVPVEKVDFLPFSEELIYLYPSTSYTVQFVSDKAITVDITLGGTQLLAQDIVQGLNRISITTPATLVDNKLIINGVGANISEVVVTDTNRKFKYFEGMKSVGECEHNVIEILLQNKNLVQNIVLGGINNTTGILTGGDATVRSETHILVKPNTEYIIKNDLSYDNYIYEYDINKNFIKLNKGRDNPYIFTTTNNTYYITFRSTGNREQVDLNVKYQLEEGSTATDYIPHAHNTQTLTHEPLRSVGDIKDKYVLIDGKWYIERNCIKYTFNGSEKNWNAKGYGGHNTRNTFEVNVKGSIHTGYKPLKSICNMFLTEKLKGIPTNDNACRVVNDDGDNNGTYFLFTPSTSIIPYRDLDAWKEWLSVNPITIIVECSPYYEPINYNPFTVYSDTTHITTNSTIPCNVIVKNHGYNLVALKENTQYTLYVNKDTTNALTYRLGDYIEINSPSKFTFTTPETLTDKTLRIDGKGAKVNDLMLIEGTPTNDSIGYFDGLKSSYECEQVTDENDVNYGKYKVDIKVVGKNKLNIPSAYNTWKGGKIAVTDGNIVTCTPASDGTQAMDYQTVFADVDFKKGTQLTLSATKIFGADYTSGSFGIGIYLRDAKGSLISGGAYRCPDFLCDDPIDTVRTTTITLTQDVAQIGLYIIAWKIQGASGDYKFKVQLEEGDTATEYEPYFESKQTIYLNSPLLKGDEIVWKDNKIQHYHKMKTVVLDGSDDENWNSNYIQDTTIRNQLPFSDIKLLSNLLCDKFNQINGGMDTEGISNHAINHVLQLTLNKNKGNIKQWLQQNPVKVVYELETPYYEEISNYPLKLNVIANSSLSTESTIQVTNISFNIYEETLPYLYPNTKYYITFNADVDRNNIIINLGGNHVVFDCKVGFNKVEITTPSDTTNLLTFSGTGVNIDHVKVTQQDIDEYFEGMKSVGECEGNVIEILSNNKNLIDPSRVVKDKDIDSKTGEVVDNSSYYALVDYVPIKPNMPLKYSATKVGTEHNPINGTMFHFYDINKKHIYSCYLLSTGLLPSSVINGKTPSNAHYLRISYGINDGWGTSYETLLTGQLEYGTTKTDYILHQSNIQQLAHEPLRAVGDYRDRYVLIDGKWYIERKYGKAVLDGSVVSGNVSSYFPSDNSSIFFIKKEDAKSYDNWLACDKFMPNINVSNSENRNVEGIFTSVNGSITAFYFRIFNNKLSTQDINGCKQYLQQNPVTVVYQLATPIYEPIDYNPFETYANITHISANSLIPTNVVVKNHGYNCILKPSTKYTIALNKPNGTISAKLGGSAKVDSTNSVFTITTPSTLNDNVLRLSGSGNVKDIMILEGDKTVNTPSYFEGIESVFEQEYDTEKGKYRVTARVEGNGKESSIIFYLNEPLRGIKGVKDKVYIQDNKMIVQRNYISVTFDGSDDEDWKTISNSYARLLLAPKPKLNSSNRCENCMCDTIRIIDNLSVGNGILVNDAVRIKTNFISNDEQARAWFAKNPTTVVYQLAEPIYEEVDCDLSKLVLENYENSSLIFESNIPISANIKYSGEVPVVTQAKALSSQVDNTTLDINENIIPYMCDIDYRIVELQLMNGDTQGEGIELLGIGDIEILGNENVLFNNREVKKYNYSYDMLKRDILSQRYSKEEYRYRLDRYLLANKISNEEYKELEGLLNNGK